MTDLNRRLDDLSSGLTFDERVDGVVAAYHQDARPHWSLLGTMPRSDIGRWNRVADMLKALDGPLGWYIDYLEACVLQLELRQTIAVQARHIGATAEPNNIAQAESAAEAFNLRLIAELVARWHELRPAELVAKHFGEQLGGRQLLHPSTGAILADCLGRMLCLQEQINVAASHQVELTEPSGHDLEEFILELLG